MLVADLPEPGWLTRSCVAAVTASSHFTDQLRTAWRLPRTTQLILPLRSEACLGRSPRCDYTVQDEAVSRRHAVLSYADGRWWVDDCGSANGTFLNGWRVSSATEVRPGDELTLANCRFTLRAPATP